MAQDQWKLQLTEVHEPPANPLLEIEFSTYTGNPKERLYWLARLGEWVVGRQTLTLPGETMTEFATVASAGGSHPYISLRWEGHVSGGANRLSSLRAWAARTRKDLDDLMPRVDERLAVERLRK